jgi:hypothetical protein
MVLVSSTTLLRAAGICCAVTAGAVLVLGSAERQATPRPDAGSDAAARLPAGLAATVSATLGGNDRRFAVSALDGGLVARGGGLETVFGPAGPAVRAASGKLSLRLEAVGREGADVRIGAAVPVARGNRVTYRHGSLDEWYVNGPLGLEQGFTLRQPPAGEGPLTIAMRTGGPLRPRLSDGEIVFADEAGETVARYGGLFAFDAAHAPLPARLELAGRRVLLRIDDAGARYPLTIDPLIQRGEKLTGSGGSADGRFGFSVALAADGSIAVVGGPYDGGNKGAAWVFTRSGETWKQQGGKLTGSGETGDGMFGWSVALAADGSTALIGGPFDAGNKGAAWVFTRSGESWDQQGGKLTGGGETGDGVFGFGVALAADGSTALIGGLLDDGGKGAAWVFTRSGESWNQQGAKLTASGESGSFGVSVALAADGRTALIGGPFDDGNKGAAWVFTRSGTAWNQQGGKLTPKGESGNSSFGASVALAEDGSLALIGGPLDDGSKGAAWVFTRSGTAWNQQGGKLTGGGESGNGRFGWNVALAADSSTALIGGPLDGSNKGAAWVFTRSGENWEQQGAKLTGSGESGDGSFGWTVALAADGSTALIGGPDDDGHKGAVWGFSSAPSAAPGASPGSAPTNTTTTTTTTAGSSSGTSTTTTTASANAVVARIVHATVLRRGKLRTLDIRIRVSRPANARLELLSKGAAKLRKTFKVKGGPNDLNAAIPSGLKKGTYKARITLTAPKARSAVYTATVRVPG